MSDFRRTHHDNWQEHKQKFTEDQLLVLTDLLVSPCYYAWMVRVALNENSTEDSALMSTYDNRTVSSAKHVPLVIRSPSDKFQKTIFSSDDICGQDPFFLTIIALCWRSFFFCRFVVVWSTAESCDVSMRLFYTWFGSRKQVLWKVTLYILVPVLKTQYLLSAWHRHSSSHAVIFRVTVTQIRCHAVVSTLSNLVKGTHRFSTIWSSF